MTQRIHEEADSNCCGSFSICLVLNAIDYLSMQCFTLVYSFCTPLSKQYIVRLTKPCLKDSCNSTLAPDLTTNTILACYGLVSMSSVKPSELFIPPIQ